MKPSIRVLNMCRLVAAAALSAGCGSDDDEQKQPPSMQPVEPSPETRVILEQIQGYSSWSTFPGHATPTRSEAHENMYVAVYHNEVVGQAVASQTLPLPDGAIIVKDNLASPTDTTPMAVTVMSKEGGSWYWLKATAEGKVAVDPTGKPLEGHGVTMCSGCHNSEKDNDYVFTHSFQSGS